MNQVPNYAAEIKYCGYAAFKFSGNQEYLLKSKLWTHFSLLIIWYKCYWTNLRIFCTSPLWSFQVGLLPRDSSILFRSPPSKRPQSSSIPSFWSTWALSYPCYLAIWSLSWCWRYARPTPLNFLSASQILLYADASMPSSLPPSDPSCISSSSGPSDSGGNSGLTLVDGLIFDWVNELLHPS